MLWISLRPRPPVYLMPLIPLIPLVLFSSFGCSKASPERENKRSLPTTYVEGSFVVTVESTTPSADVAKLGSDVGAALACRTSAPQKIDWGSSGSDGSDGPGVLSEQLENTYNIKYENCDLSRDGTAAILEKFAAAASVLSVEAEASVASTPVVENDPRKSSETFLKSVKRDDACREARKNSKPIIVAVVDTGIDINHPELRDMIWRDSSGQIIGANFVGSGATMPPDLNVNDGEGHGTHVSGLIAAAANNGKGIVGVASCANVKIMPIRVLGDGGRGTSIEIERGVKWAADHGAHVINMSLGYVATTYRVNTNFYRSLYATLAAQNIMVFAAAGNDGIVNGDRNADGEYQYNFPSSYDNVVAVAATNDSGSLTSFSNRGLRVDIAAPGYQLLSTVPGSYDYMSGTSMASPVAAGIYALALASAQAGLTTGDRIDTSAGLEMLVQATSKQSFEEQIVGSRGLIDAEKLVSLVNARFPVATSGDDAGDDKSDDTTVVMPPVTTPTTPTVPTTPTQPTTPSVNLHFVGLADGARAGLPQGIKIAGVPQGTYAVYLYWGEGSYFSKIYIPHGQSGIESREFSDASRWFFYGKKSLKAVAYSSNGKVLARTAITVRGF